MVKRALLDWVKTAVLKNEKKTKGIFTFKRDPSSGLPSQEVEGAADPVSSPCNRQSLVTCCERIKNHSSEINKVRWWAPVKCKFVVMSGTWGKHNYNCLSLLSIQGWSHLQTLIESQWHLWITKPIEWMKEWLIDWLYWLNEWINAWIREGREERKSRWMDAWGEDEWMKQSRNERTNK